jgi:isocitrate dehydrogenase (NAD+)
MASKLRNAIDATVNLDTIKTGDLGGKASTSEFTAGLVCRIHAAG